MTTINTNVQSLNAQRNLAASQSSLSTSMQRLSSGLRINSAKDDAAGLAISERMSAQVRGLNVAARNANDGISLAQTAEGSLGKVGDMVQRIRELAVQSANATNTATDRASLQSEVAELTAEIQRVATQHSFNNTKLLDGSFTSQNFQVGANVGEVISLTSLANVQLASLGQLQANDTYTQTLGAAAATVFANGMSMSINGVTVSSAGGAADAPSAVTAFKAAFDAAKLVNTNNATLNTGLANVTMTAAGAITSTDQNLTLSAFTNISGPAAGTTAGAVTAGATTTGIVGLNISTTQGATRAITAMDTALSAINTARGTMGTIQSRFENAISNINVTSENLSAARGRIVDADFAKETSNLSRAQILQQAGTAMVAQANQLPQGVLSLLR
jgi:flagellin